jgi:hypothetical protein
MPGTGDLDRRVLRLEREARGWRAAAVLSILFAAVAWIVPSVSAQTQTIKADTIYARQISVVPDPDKLSAASPAVRLFANQTQATLSVGGPTEFVSVSTETPVGAFLSVHGYTAAVTVWGPNPGGPSVTIGATDQQARVEAFDVSKALASMGFQPNVPGAFRAYDPGQNDPVWTAP